MGAGAEDDDEDVGGEADGGGTRNRATGWAEGGGVARIDGMR